MFVEKLLLVELSATPPHRNQQELHLDKVDREMTGNETNTGLRCDRPACGLKKLKYVEGNNPQKVENDAETETSSDFSSDKTLRADKPKRSLSVKINKIFRFVLCEQQRRVILNLNLPSDAGSLFLI